MPPGRTTSTASARPRPAATSGRTSSSRCSTASYYQLCWTLLGDALAKFVDKGDWQTIKGLFEGFGGRGDDNGYAVYLAVQCADVKWPRSWQQWKHDNWRTYQKAPYFTWPAKPGKPVKVDGKKVPSVLMIGETLDAVTTYEGSLEVRSRFPGARLIGEPGGTSHAISPRGNACVDNRIADYLATGALPDRKPGRTADLECAPLPPPAPTASAPQAATSRVPVQLQVREGRLPSAQVQGPG